MAFVGALLAAPCFFDIVFGILLGAASGAPTICEYQSY
jgi:hypothetical protein